MFISGLKIPKFECTHYLYSRTGITHKLAIDVRVHFKNSDRQLNGKNDALCMKGTPEKIAIFSLDGKYYPPSTVRLKHAGSFGHLLF